jgi:hypothetical protein
MSVTKVAAFIPATWPHTTTVEMHGAMTEEEGRHAAFSRQS